MGSKVLICGGSGGIGAAIARILHARGFALHLTGRNEERLAALAAELAPKVRVNAIAPSLIRTPLTESLLANEQMAVALAGMHPLQRLGSPADAAALAAFLISKEADWITGQIIGVDGGRASLRTKN